MPIPRAQAVPAGLWDASDDLNLDRWWPNLKLQYYDGNRLYASASESIYRSSDLGDTWELLGTLPVDARGPLRSLRTWVARGRLGRHFRRHSPLKHVLVLRSGTILAYRSGSPSSSDNGSIYRSADGGHSWELAYRFREKPEGKRLLRQWTEDGKGAVWVGEYGVEKKADSAILRGDDDGKRWEVTHRFPRSGQNGGVRHVHGLQWDTFARKVWVTTGDSDEESRIGWLDDQGGFVQLSTGGQEWRAVSLLFTETAVFWGSDTAQAPKTVCRWDRQTGQLDLVQDLGGPVLHSTKLGNGSLLLSTEITEALNDRAELWASPDGLDWRRVATGQPHADKLDGRYGTWSFPLGQPPPRLFVNVERLGKENRGAYRGSLQAR